MRPDISGHGEEISPFTSIVQSFYWVVITAVRVCVLCVAVDVWQAAHDAWCFVQTTVGYGDLTPTTVAGKVTATVLTHFGILALALPITVRLCMCLCLGQCPRGCVWRLLLTRFVHRSLALTSLWSTPWMSLRRTGSGWRLH